MEQSRFALIRIESHYACYGVAPFLTEYEKLMRALSPAKLCLFSSLVIASAQAETNRPGAASSEGDAIGSGLTELLSLATLGAVSTQEQAAQITQSGSDYLVRLPLTGLSTPADAAVKAIAHPLHGGMWDISAITFPVFGSIEAITPDLGINRLSYAIGEQTTHAEIDPMFTQPASFTANFGDISVHSDRGGTQSEQVIDHYTTDGTLSATSADRLGVSLRGKATNWHLTVHGANGFEANSSIRTLSGQFSVEGLDRAQGTRLVAATRALTGVRMSETSPVSGIPPEQRQALHVLVDAIPGLLSRFHAEETVDDLRFAMGNGRNGTVDRLRIDVAGDAAEARFNAQMDLAIDGFIIASIPAETVAYVPRHIDLKSIIANMRTAPLMALLRAATEQGADQAALQIQLKALFEDKTTRIGIESLAFDSGPMHVTGSARVIPQADGDLSCDIHMAATGMDVLIAQLQGKPALQQVLPVMFMAKGMGRPEGSAIVWDIVLNDGPLTVNGVPFGQAPGFKW